MEESSHRDADFESGRPRRSRRDDYDDDRDYHDRPRRRRNYDDDYDRRDPMDDPTMRMLLPVGRSPWAVISGYLGLISVLLFPAPFALWTGFLAKREMRRDPKLHGMGRAVFGIIMGSLFTLVLLIVGVALLVRLIQGK